MTTSPHEQSALLLSGESDVIMLQSHSHVDIVEEITVDDSVLMGLSVESPVGPYRRTSGTTKKQIAFAQLSLQ